VQVIGEPHSFPTPRATPRASHAARARARSSSGPGEFTFAALATGGISVLAVGNALASGEPALSLLAAFGVALLVLGVVGAFFGLRDVAVAIDAPYDVVVGSDARLRLTLGGSGHATCTVRLLDPPTRAHDATVGARGTLSWYAPRRGVWETLRVEVRSSWPFGIFQRRKVFDVALDAPMHVAPRATPYDVGPHRMNDDGPRPSMTTPAGGDLVRSVRPYRAGDPPKWVHWPSTARGRELMVREFEPAVDCDVTIRVTLSTDPAVAEPAAARAVGAGRAVLRSGRPLTLVTREVQGTVTDAVRTDRELGRRLARAVAGPLDTPAPTDVVEIA
jgi:uncharacterized protein (DUF58 family)